MAIVALGAATLLGFLDRLSWVFEFGTFFRLQYAVLLAVVSAAALLLRHFRAASAGIALAALNVAVVAPAWGSPPQGGLINQATVRVLVVNVDVANDRYSDVADLIRQVQPDIVGVTELSPAWVRGLAPALASYRERELEPEPSAYGIGIYSKRQLFDARIERFPAEDGPASVVVTIEIDGRPLTFVLTHVHTPFAGAIHSRQLEALADARAGLGERLAVCGDFNAVPWSAPFRALADRGGLHATSGMGWSWPTWGRLLGVPLDNCLVSDGIAVVEREHGPDVGSDHRPLVIELGITGLGSDSEDPANP